MFVENMGLSMMEEYSRNEVITVRLRETGSPIPRPLYCPYSPQVRESCKRWEPRANPQLVFGDETRTLPVIARPKTLTSGLAALRSRSSALTLQTLYEYLTITVAASV
jgi:hypothetical protein